MAQQPPLLAEPARGRASSGGSSIPTYYVLRLLSLVGIVWDIKEPPKHVVEGNKVRSAT